MHHTTTCTAHTASHYDLYCLYCITLRPVLLILHHTTACTAHTASHYGLYCPYCITLRSVLPILHHAMACTAHTASHYGLYCPYCITLRPVLSILHHYTACTAVPLICTLWTVMHHSLANLMCTDSVYCLYCTTLRPVLQPLISTSYTTVPHVHCLHCASHMCCLYCNHCSTVPHLYCLYCNTSYVLHVLCSSATAPQRALPRPLQRQLHQPLGPCVTAAAAAGTNLGEAGEAVLPPVLPLFRGSGGVNR